MAYVAADLALAAHEASWRSRGHVCRLGSQCWLLWAGSASFGLVASCTWYLTTVVESAPLASLLAYN